LASLTEVGISAGTTPILERIELEVEAGECVGISGPNGSGKTTLLRILATLLRPTHGTGTVLGARLGTDAVFKVRRRIGLAGHQPSLYPELTLAENLELVCRLAGLPDGRARAALDQVGLGRAADRRTDRCSHGMQRRTDLARLLITAPQLLLLDEAHAGLDASAQPIVATLVKRTIGGGGAAVLVTHDPTTLDELAGRILPLAAGVLGVRT
jgi:heme ABC exporter ATP-binding subunit CcmA